MSDERARLRSALLARYGWLAATEVGPKAVDAGECDRCGREARLVETCGPIAWGYLGRGCASQLGEDAWCAGHTEQGQEALAWLAALPEEADDVARLWWVATGEVRLDPHGTRVRAGRLGLPAAEA